MLKKLLVATAALGFSGLALATFSTEQLEALRPRWLQELVGGGRSEPQAATTRIAETGPNPGTNPATQNDAPDRPARARRARRG